MDALNKLTGCFREFPGIGPRQARRFAYFLLGKSPSFSDELARLVVEIKKSMRVCESCFRFFPNSSKNNHTLLCSICSDSERDQGLLMVVARDVDLEAIEKSGTYNGLYFILGGTVPILEKNPETRVRSGEILKRIEAGGNKKEDEKTAKKSIREIILSLSVTPEGEHTEEIIRFLLKPFALKNGIKISVLGRGLSTGTELEYSDADTIKNALKNRA